MVWWHMMVAWCSVSFPSSAVRRVVCLLMKMSVLFAFEDLGVEFCPNVGHNDMKRYLSASCGTTAWQVTDEWCWLA